MSDTSTIDSTVRSAESAFEDYRRASRGDRANFLRRIADEIERRGESITRIANRETALPEARLEGERSRTTGQLRLFASHIEDGAYLDYRHDAAIPDRAPLPRPDLRVWQIPVGPVAVFGASNFPLAFSVAGGDTASALAAGCTVVAKGHPAHPGTCEIVAEAIEAAAADCEMPAGTFSLLRGTSNAVGEALVTHPLIQAVGFTGSLAGGRALFDLCAGRPQPIPFFGELGSVNPVFILPGAIDSRADALGQGWATSLTMGVGQFCTNPGVVIAPCGESTEWFIRAASARLASVGEQTMLTEGIAAGFRAGVTRIESASAARKRIGAASDGRDASPYLFSVSGERWLDQPALHDEVFGPLGIVVEAADETEMLEIAANLDGQLTCTIHYDSTDEDTVRRLLPILERKAGRLVGNGFPTGVEVCDAMMHGGPYPASTNVGATSVGTLAIRRFLRPVCYQDLSANLAAPNPE